MTIIWPAALSPSASNPKYFARSNYGRTRKANTVVTQMDSGPVKTRKFQENTSYIYTLGIELDGDELDTFWTFYTSTTEDGTLGFQMHDPVSPTDTYNWTFYKVNQPDPRETTTGPDSFTVTFELERGTVVP